MSSPKTSSGPLIKWPGGKAGEYERIRELIPVFNRYIEPFFGGGAVFFALQPAKAVINDVAADLMNLYRFVKDEYDITTFEKEIDAYVVNWEKIPKYINLFESDFVSLYRDYARGKLSENNLGTNVLKMLDARVEEFNGLFKVDFCLDRKNLERQIARNLTSKITRMAFLEEQYGKLSIEDVRKNIEAAFRSGFYTHFRDVLNKKVQHSKITKAKSIANYYFIREFCYGGMFRFNERGEFNVPYGGIAYNGKNFRKKVERLCHPDTRELFSGTTICSEDFEKLFNRLNLSFGDFLFLDPPYDSEFSDYDQTEFNHNDQIRLAQCLYKTKAKFLLIIKKTPFIFNLYKNKPNITISAFDKTYLYNIKGRNDRLVEHLIIRNF